MTALRILSRIKLYPLALVAYAMLFYLAATGDISWYFYALLAYVVFERSLLQLISYISSIMIARATAEAMKQLRTAAVNQGGTSILGGKPE